MLTKHPCKLLAFTSGQFHRKCYPWSVFENYQSNITTTSPGVQWVNSLAPGKFEWNFGYVIFKRILVIDGWGISCEINLIWMSQDFTDDQSTLVQVMACCRWATSHYLSQCWPRSLSPYGVTRPQWVNTWPGILKDSPSAPGNNNTTCLPTPVLW